MGEEVVVVNSVVITADHLTLQESCCHVFTGENMNSVGPTL